MNNSDICQVNYDYIIFSTVGSIQSGTPEKVQHIIDCTVEQTTGRTGEYDNLHNHLLEEHARTVYQTGSRVEIIRATGGVHTGRTGALH